MELTAPGIFGQGKPPVCFEVVGGSFENCPAIIAARDQMIEAAFDIDSRFWRMARGFYLRRVTVLFSLLQLNRKSCFFLFCS